MRQFEKGRRLLGTITHAKSLPMVEALGYTGLDFIVFDMEHCAMGTDEMARCLTAATAAGLKALVRVPDGSRAHILHMLDLGADGIIVPGISTVEEVRELVRHAKFMPLGNRGYCMTRDGGWGYAEHSSHGLQAYMEHCSKNTLLLPQCETVGCLEHIEEVLAVEGVDGVLIGPYDLSMDMGIPGQFDDPRHKEAIARIYRACTDAGKLALNFCGNAEAASRAFAQGCDAAVLGRRCRNVFRWKADHPDQGQAQEKETLGADADTGLSGGNFQTQRITKTVPIHHRHGFYDNHFFWGTR